MFEVTAPGDYSLSFLGGDDSLVIDCDAVVTAMMGDGDDHVRLLAGLATVDGGAGNDIFLFEAALTGFRIDGGGGNDAFFGAGFASSGEALGGAGNDRFSGFGEGVTLAGGAGDDSYQLDIGPGALLVERPREGSDTIETEATADFTLPSGVENLVIGGGASRSRSPATCWTTRWQGAAAPRR